MDTYAPLFKLAKRERYDRGEIIVSPNNPPRGVHFIQQGYVKVYDIQPSGTLQIITVLGPNEIFPLYWAIDDDTQHLFYETLAPSVLSVVHKSTFKEVIENDPAYMRITINILLHYYRVFQERIQNLELTTVRERVAFRLLFLGKYLGQANGAEITLAVPITDEELADSINTSRETANRVLSQLIAEGYLRKQGRELVIVDPQGLHAIDGEFEALDN